MEVHLRLSVPDRPGALAAAAGAIGAAGGDIAAVTVVETADGRALDDIEIVIEPSAMHAVLAAIGGLDGVELVHTGPSRGLPGDAVARLAIGLESLLNGAMAPDHAVTALIGGLLGAARADLVDSGAPRGSERVMVLDYDGRQLVVERDYRFTATERDRAMAILRACRQAIAAITADEAPSRR